jgi:hypothetical protein
LIINCHNYRKHQSKFGAIARHRHPHADFMPHKPLNGREARRLNVSEYSTELYRNAN